MTDAIILAAGKGERLLPLTKNKPKCCLKFNEIELIKYQIKILKKAKVKNITIVAGHKAESIKKLGYKTIENLEFESTNMVESLFFSDKFFDQLNDDLIVSYGDIIYQYSNLKKILSSLDPISIMIDTNWLELWKIRMENPIDDAESLKLDENNNIIEIGKKINTLKSVEGQYTGLIKIKKEKVFELRRYYNSSYNNFDKNMYLTEFLQSLIDNGEKVSASLVNNGWLEFDNISDFEIYEKLLKKKRLNKFFDLTK